MQENKLEILKITSCSNLVQSLLKKQLLVHFSILPSKTHYLCNKKTNLKKKLLSKVLELKLEKLIFKIIEFKAVISIKNVFTLFKVRSILKVPKNAVI
jgi:hypothetical protein